MKLRRIGSIGFGVALALSLALTGCSTLGSAISMALNSQQSSGTQSTGNGDQASQNSGAKDQAPGPTKNANADNENAQAYSMQFGSFYSAFWNFGWFGYGDPNYHPGQGTVWEISDGSSKSKPTFERALLKTGADGSEWWRFALTNDGDTFIFEFLATKDGTVQKVRFKDPDSGQIVEFVPSASSAQQPSRSPQLTREQIASSLVGHEQITVPAGTFPTDHYQYNDAQSGYRSDIWIGQNVPGYMVKFSSAASNGKAAATGQLIKIESGVTTQLGSF